MLEDGARTYVWGLGLAYSVDASNAIRVYHTDGLDSVWALTVASGNVVQTYEQDGFGVPGRGRGAGCGPFGYVGEWRDAGGRRPSTTPPAGSSRPVVGWRPRHGDADATDLKTAHELGHHALPERP